MMLRLSGLLLFACFSLRPQAAPADKAQVQQAIREKVKGFRGTVSLTAKNLRTGATITVDGSSPVRTASTIKLAIMVECFAEAAEGKLDLAERIRLDGSEKVSGSGVLQDLSSNDELPLRDMIDLMIVLSDNTATNLILNRIGGNAVNERMQHLGLKNTRVMRKILGDRNDLKPEPSGVTIEGAKPENKRWGIGRSSPDEMVWLLEQLYRGELVSPAASRDMLDILKRQRDHNGIARDLKDVTIASKSGALDALRSDVGIVFTAGAPVAIAITVDDMPEPNWTPENPGELLISRISELLLKGLVTSP